MLVYESVVTNIQNELAQLGYFYPLTQSTIEIWKEIYAKQHHVISAIVPDYPLYRRDWALSIVTVNHLTDWSLINRADWEYLRVIEFFATKERNQDKIIIDLSFYDVNQGLYWADLDVSEVVRYVEGK